MGMKARQKRGARYQNAQGKPWEIGASGLTLWESSAVQSSTFDDYDDLFKAAGKRIRTKKKAGYVLVGNRAASDRSVHNQVTPEQIENVKSQFGARRSIWTDTWKELDEVLQDPEGYEGGVLLIDGDVVIDGHWDVRSYAAVIVLGSLEVKGLLYQYETEPWFIVTGDLRVQNLVMAGNMDIGGDFIATESAEFESGLGYAHIAGHLEASTLIVWDMPVTCTTLKANRYLSANQLPVRICDKASVSQSIGHKGADLPKLYGKSVLGFSDCILEFHGLEGAERNADIASDSIPEIKLDQRELVHLLGLPLVR